MPNKKRRATKKVAAKHSDRKSTKKIAKKKLVRKSATKAVAGKSGRTKSMWQKTVAAFLRAAAEHKKELAGAHEHVDTAAFQAALTTAPTTPAPPPDPPGSCTIRPPIDGVKGRCVDGVKKDFCDRMGVQLHVQADFKSGGKCPPG